MSGDNIGDFFLRETLSTNAPRHHRRRITLNVEIMRKYGLSTGNLLTIQHDQGVFFAGIAWPSNDLALECVALHTLLIEEIGIRPSSRVCVQRLKDSHVMPAGLVVVEECSSKAGSGTGKLGNTEEEWLKMSIRETLVEMRHVWFRQQLRLPWEDGFRVFTIVRIQASTTLASSISEKMEALEISERTVWAVGWHCQVEFAHKKQRPEITMVEGDRNVSPYHNVGGLSTQIALIRDLIEIPLTRPHLFSHFNLKPPKGVLLHGPPGTGKTHLARAIATSTNSRVLVVNGPEISSAYHGESEQRLREVFERAKRSSPCIVVLDEVDAICPKRDDGGDGNEVGKRVVATLLTLLDGMDDSTAQGAHVVVVATTNRPNAIDPALRRPGRFDREVEIGIPDVPARLDILRVLLRKTPHTLTESQLQIISAQTHGYVGADLAGLVREAGTLAIKRMLDSSRIQEHGVITFADFLHALPSIRPSALRSLIVETPRVSWSDIGGVSHIRERLREAIEWPLLHPETFARLGVQPTKGLLLYGPPGCSKTLTAKALATESGINFLSVKGPELLNKYVGESERAVREVFAKARAGAPCIIFFDEIDALGTARNDDRTSGAHEGVLTSMLNEMDGIQELQGVIVVAATNRPDVMDSALMRPGRLDKILYVGPPDARGREEILRIRTRHMTIEAGIDFALLAQMTEGCSGAELTAMCQDAATLAMREDVNAPYVSRQHFEKAAKHVRKGITREMVESYDRWRISNGLTNSS